MNLLITCNSKSREWWKQDNSYVKMDGLELDNSKLTTCALELDIFIFSALELKNSKVITYALELNSSILMHWS